MTEEERYPPILDDLPTGRDALDFAPYVDALADILLDTHTRTPLTLGVFGSWGAGKTSLMTMLRAKVAGGAEQTATPFHRTVWFNAWKYNQEEALWRALLLVLLDDLERLLEADPPPPVEDAPRPEELLALLREALYRETAWTERGELKPNWTQALTSGAGLAFNLILSGVGLGLPQKAWEEAQKALGKGEPVSQMGKLIEAFRREDLTHYQAQLRSMEQFQDNFQRLVEVLLRRRGERPRRLVVFVDDLDRCLPEKAMQVLEALKLFLDVPGCIFVLGLDREAIESAVQVRYKGEVKAREYLEKIIQLPFILPPIEETPMRQYVHELAPALPDPRCEEVFSQGLSPNPRQVKRTLNIFLLLSRLVEKRAALKETITPVRLAKVVAIQHAHADLYRLLRVRPGYLRELEAFFHAQAEAGRREGMEGELPRLPEALAPFQARDPLRRLLLVCDEEDARFDGLTPLELRSYITLARRATPVETPAVRVARLRFEPEMVPVPAGPFLMGTSEEQVGAMLARFEWAKEIQNSFKREQPQHEVTLAAFEIGRYPVTHAEYAAFVEATGHEAPRHWREGRFPEEQADHPVVYVTWHDAQAYVSWLRERTGEPYHLPSEAEWEKAARGDDGRLWPWGSDWDPAGANCQPAGPGSTTPVGQYSPKGDSPWGVADMAGHALGVVVDSGDEAIAEELALESGHTEVVLDVACGFFQVKGFEVEADGDALAESLVGSETELVGQVRLAEEDEGQEGGGIHLVVEQETQLVKEFWGQEMSFVNDEQDIAALASQVLEGGAELRQEAHEAKGRLDLEGKEDFAIEGGDAQVGVGEVDDGVEVVVEAVGESADGGGLAGAHVAGDEGGVVVLQGEGQTALDFAVTARGIKVFGGDRFGEGGMAEAVELIEAGHCSPPIG